MEVFMSQRNVLLLMLVFVMAMFGALVAYDMTANHRLDKFLGKEQTQNWKWKDTWTDNSPTPEIEDKIVDETKPEVVPEVAEQIVASSYQDAIKKSKESNKQILIMFKAEWCHWCKKMEADSLTDSKVKTEMMNYVYLEVDTDRDNATTRKFGVSGLPSYVISNANGDKIKSDNGYRNAKQFAQWLKK